VSHSPTIQAASDHSLLVTFGYRIDPAMHERVRALLESLQSKPQAGVINLHPAYASLLVDFDPAQLSIESLETTLWERLQHDAQPSAPRTVEIQVRYGGQSGPDLEEVARHCNMRPEEVVALHCAGEYLVYFLGFSPGFPYLGGMDSALATPRRATPRKSVAAGSVGIAGSQTGIYPLDSPGGWQIIGRTEARIFDPYRNPPELLRMGDRVRFAPVLD
jgi:KipI family sensor histidine kinase inhibitor